MLPRVIIVAFVSVGSARMRAHPAVPNTNFWKQSRLAPASLYVVSPNQSTDAAASFAAAEFDKVVHALSSSYARLQAAAVQPYVVDQPGENGVGNHLFIVCSNAILAVASQRRLVVASPLVNAMYRLPDSVLTKRPNSSAVHTSVLRGHESVASAFESKRGHNLETYWFWPSQLAQLDSVNTAFQQLGAHPSQARNGAWLMEVVARWLFGAPKIALQRMHNRGAQLLARHCKQEMLGPAVGARPFSYAVVHLRTYADWVCKSANAGTVECGQCVAKPALGCMERWAERLHRALAPTQVCVLVLSDKPSLAETVARQLTGTNIKAVSETQLFSQNVSFGARAQNFGHGGQWYTANSVHGLSPSFLGWTLLAGADARVVTKTSTFGASAALCGGTKRHDIQLDLQCIPEGAQEVAKTSQQNWRFEALLADAPTLQHANGAMSWTYAQGKWEARADFILQPGRDDVPACTFCRASMRCKMRRSSLREAKDKCEQEARCVGVFRDKGLPCDVISGNAQYQYDCLVPGMSAAPAGQSSTNLTAMAGQAAIRQRATHRQKLAPLRPILVEREGQQVDFIGRGCVPFAPTDPSPRILVTGGAGFVGSHLVARLLKPPWYGTMKVVDNLWRGQLRNLIDTHGNPLLDFRRDVCIGDLTDYSVADRMTRHAETVYHLADIVAGIDFVFSNQAFIFDTNLRVNLNTVRAARANGVHAFVYTATACSFPKELQSNYSVVSIPEDRLYPANPESSYGWSKLMGEYHLRREQLADNSNNNQLASTGFQVGIVRLHNVYGPRSPYSNGSQALPALIRKAIRYPAEGFQVMGTGMQYRDFLHVDDAVSAILAVRSRGMNHGPIQAGTGEAVTLGHAAKEVAKLARKILGKRIVPTFDNAFEGDKGRIADLTRARAILGWKAQVNFSEGLRDTFKWIMRDIHHPVRDVRHPA